MIELGEPLSRLWPSSKPFLVQIYKYYPRNEHSGEQNIHGKSDKRREFMKYF